MRFFAVALVLAPIAVRADAQKDKTLALAAVTARGGADPDDASTMSDAVTELLVEDGRVRLVERQELQRVMKEQALAQSGVMSDEVQLKVAQLVNARFIAVGTVQKKSGRYVLSLRAIDSESGQVAFAQTLKVGSDEQIEAGSQQLARKMIDKLLPGTSSQAQASNDAIGDFDAGQVKDGARQLVRAISMKFPKLAGTIIEALPNGTASCSFPMSNIGFSGQFFEISGVDDVTGQERTKGYFLLSRLNQQGCSGRLKSEPGQAIVNGDTLTPVPIKFDVMPLEAASGAQPELAKLLTDETRAAVETLPQFQLSKDPQLTAMGRVAGPRGRRSVEVQVLDKKGNVVAKVDQQLGF